MKVAIIGSRTFDDYSLLSSSVWEFCNLSCQWDTIISGGAKGADALAERYAKEEEIPVQIIKPDWKTYGKQAGMLRNSKIIAACDIVLAFWDGQSRGTKDSIDKARAMKKPTFIVYF